MFVAIMIVQSEYYDTQLKIAVTLAKLFKFVHMFVSRNMK